MITSVIYTSIQPPPLVVIFVWVGVDDSNDFKYSQICSFLEQRIKSPKGFAIHCIWATSCFEFEFNLCKIILKYAETLELQLEKDTILIFFWQGLQRNPRELGLGWASGSLSVHVRLGIGPWSPLDGAEYCRRDDVKEIREFDRQCKHRGESDWCRGVLKGIFKTAHRI